MHTSFFLAPSVYSALADPAKKFSKEERLVEWFKGFLLQQMGIQVKIEF